MEISKKILFIGSGNMGGAIISGLIKSNLVKAQNITCDDVLKEKVEELSKKFGICVSQNKEKSVGEAGIIFLSVKPQNITQVLESIKPFVKKNTLIISIAAGITTSYIEKTIGNDVCVVRAMPNTPALVLQGTTALCKGKNTQDIQLQTAKTLFGAIGKVAILDEKHFDTITALSGSGPAYVFYLCELMCEAACKMGLDKETATVFAANTIYGAGKMLDATNTSATRLREIVTSPHGTTEAAINYFQSQNLSDIVLKAMQEAQRRSKELSK